MSVALLETAAVTAGRVVVDRAGRQWLSHRKSAADRSKPLAELIGLNFRDSFSRRRLERQLDDISDSVTERLQAMSEIEYRSLSDNDKSAAIDEAARVLSAADLSDETIFGVDIEGIRLARSLIADNESRLSRLGLSEAGEKFFELVLQECCECLMQILQHLPQYSSRAASEALNRLSTISANVSLALTRIPIRRLESPEGEEFDAEFRNRYLRLLAESLSEVEVFGVPVNNYTPRATLSIAYISLSVTGEWESGNEPGELKQGSEGAVDYLGGGKSLRVENVLAGNARNLIRGEAGSGKSTLLQWIATSAARSAFKKELASWNGTVPFIIKLRSYAEEDLPAPEEFVRAATPSIAGIMPAGWAHRQLASNRAILLVDGVDELPVRRRPKVRSWLRGLITAYPELRIVVTSRPSAAASSWLNSENFRSSQLERMTSADIRQFISHWHAAILDSGVYPCTPNQIVSYERSLSQRIASQSHLQSLAATPLLTAMLCALNLDRRTQLPRDRMGLYAAALEMLLERRDAERQIPSYFEVSLERRQKILVLQDLAWRLSMTNRTELPKNAALQRVREKAQTMPHLDYEADAVLEHLIHRSGVIREPVLGRIDFIHRTFQEYLTAKQAADDGDVEPLVAKAHLDQWRDTVIMSAGHANSPLRHELIEGLLARIEAEPRHRRSLRLLVSACFETMPDIPRDLSKKIDNCLRSLVPPRNDNEATSLPRAGDAVLRFFPTEVNSSTESVALNTIKAAYLINGIEALQLLRSYAADSRPPVQRQLVQGWDHYDYKEYADAVISQVPFHDGLLTLSNPAHFAFIGRLPQVRTVEFDGEVADPADLKPGRALTRRFHGKIQSPDHSELGNHQALEDIILVSGEVNDLDWVRKLPALQELRVWAEGIKNLEPLRALSLRLLGLSYLSDVDDFTPIWELAGVNWLILRNCAQLGDVREMRRLTRLRTLVLEAPGGIEGLRDVMQSNGIEWFGLQKYEAGVSLSEFNSRSLEVLDLGGTEVVESDDKIEMPKLRELYLDSWSGSALPQIGSLGSLEKVSIDYAENLEDISELLKLPALKQVSLLGCPEGLDLTPLASNEVDVIDSREPHGDYASHRPMPRSDAHE
ncbi:NACHT domain-containing protein [Streptomyces sp. NPDC055642]